MNDWFSAIAGVPGYIDHWTRPSQPAPMQNMPGNPMLEGLLAAVAAKNPEVVADAASAAGIPPPSMAPGMGADMGSIGAFMQPMAPEALQGPGAIGPWQTQVIPNSVPNGMQDNRDPSAGLAGFKAPQVDNRPIMNAGVSGAQKAPEVSAGQGLQAQQLFGQLLQQMMAGRPSPVPTLGQMIGG